LDGIVPYVGSLREAEIQEIHENLAAQMEINQLDLIRRFTNEEERNNR
jgi:hypothetical protein